MTKAIIIILSLLLLYTAVQVIRTKHFIRIGEGLAAEAAPRAYEQHPENPSMRILNIGDSSVVGTGAEDPKLSVAGRLGADFPSADITNLGVNGTKTGELIERFQGIQDQRFDLIVIHTGGNDIVRFIPYEELERDLPQVLDLANNIGNEVVLLHGGNVGTSTLFPAPTRWIFTKRTAAVRDIWIQMSEEKGVHYVDLFRRGKDDPFWADPQKYYAADGFHPSDHGYGDWYAHIKEVLDEIGFGQ